MKFYRLYLPFLVLALNAFPQATTTGDVGSGAPNETISQRFVNAFFRNGFYTFVSTPPIADVKKLGTTGYYQEFQDSNKTSGVKLALIKASSSLVLADEAVDVFQVRATMYAYFNTVGVGTAGYPLSDTLSCPTVGGGTCTYQIFDKKYALFVYSVAITNGQNFAVRDPFYSYWTSQSGISSFGPAVSAETATTSSAGTVATAQYFDQGALFNITSGALSGKLINVRQPIYSVYTANGGATGTLGFPAGDILTLPNGMKRQQFEGGSVDYDPNTSAATLRLPVSLIALTPSITTLRLNLNDTFILNAAARASNGLELPDRVINFTTTNGKVVSIQSTGAIATLKATGGGVATVSATSEGKISQQIAVFVTAPCCNIGEGAPNATAAQSFVDAVVRNKLSVKIPSTNPVRRNGTGYTQEFNTADGSRVLIALADRSAQAYAVSGALLSRWEELAGATGALGYPTVDATTGGRQNFENGAFAGVPVRVVTGSLLAKWALLGYETGVLGSPASDPATYFTFAASSGIRQSFRSGGLYAAQNGPAAGRVFYTTGLIHSRFDSLNGVNGKFGTPLADEFLSAGKHRQDFEGGFFDYSTGDTLARSVEKARTPAVTVTPSSVVAGSRAMLSVGGFDSPVTLRISVTGQPDFQVRSDSGAYNWDIFVPTNAPSRTVTVTAVDIAGAARASTTYAIRAAAEAKLTLGIASGDKQSGLPGAVLNSPLRVILRDEGGNPLSGVPVSFIASPGAVVSPSTVSTNVDGTASTQMRLPSAAGLAEVTASYQRQIVTFRAIANATSLTGLTRITTTGDPLLASAAVLLRYYQDRGELSLAGGQASVALLDSYLKGFCAFDVTGAQICDGQVAAGSSGAAIPNLWRLPGVVGGNLEVIPVAANINSIRDQLGQDNPLLLSLALNGGGYHSVVATGLGADGGLTILDPSAAFSRTNLNDYLNGFTASGVPIKATLAGAIRLSPRTPITAGFLITSTASIVLASPAGNCGADFDIAATGARVHFRFCDGSQPLFQLELSAAASYTGTVTDLGNPASRADLAGSKAGSFRVSRPSTIWEPSPLEASFSAQSVVSAASFSPEIAPGGLVSIFGIGLARAGAKTTVDIGGSAAAVLSASAFQINAAVPLELKPGSYTMTVQSPFGSGEAQIDVRNAAPAIFQLASLQGAVVNQDGTINGANNPAPRGQAIVIYCTGLGAVVADGNLRRAVLPVTVKVGATVITPFFAGLTPNFVGLYQVNAILPSAMPPGLTLPLSLNEGGTQSLPVTVSVQ